jgi:hypothetical protein
MAQNPGGKRTPQQKRKQRENHRRTLKAERSQRRENKEREHFIEPLTGKRARHVAGAEAATEYNPLIRGKAGEVRGSKQREGEVGNWYNELAQNNLSAVQVANQAYSTQQNAQTQQIANANDQSQAALQNLTANDAAAAARYGGPVNTEGLAKIGAANQELAAQRMIGAAPLAAPGAHNVARLAGAVNIAGLAGIKARGVQHRETQKLGQDLTKIRREKGAAKVANLGKLREGEANRQTAKESFNYEKGQNAQKAETEAQQFKYERGQDAIEHEENKIEHLEKQAERSEGRHQQELENQIAEAKLGLEKYKAHHPSSSGGNGLTPSEKKTRQENWQDAKATVKSLWPTLRTSKKFISQPVNSRWSIFEQFVREEGVDPHLAHKAVAELRRRIEGGGGTGTAQGGVHR